MNTLNLSGASITFIATDETETVIGDGDTVTYEDLMRTVETMVRQRPDYVSHQIGDRIIRGDMSVLQTSSTPSGGEGAFERLYQRSVERLNNDWADSFIYGAITPSPPPKKFTEYEQSIIDNERNKR